MDTLSGEKTVKIHFVPFWKGIYSKRKEFAPVGANSSFLLE